MSARRTTRPARPRRPSGPSPLRAWAGPGLRLLVGMALAGALVLATLAWLRFDPDALLPIGAIEVTGAERADAGEIRALARAHAPGFVGADLEGLGAEIRALPWVASVQLRRRWPDVLEVRVREPVPVAQWGEDHLVDRHGRLFGPVDLADWEFLPALEGTDGRQVVLMHRYLEVAARLADAGFEVTGIREGERHDWTIRLASGARVLMGRDDDLRRLGQLVRAAPALRARRDAPLARVDMRYPHGIAVAWNEAADQGPEDAR